MFLFSAVNFLVGYAFNPAYKTGVHLIGYAMWYLWALFFFVYLTVNLFFLLEDNEQLMFIFFTC